MSRCCTPAVENGRLGEKMWCRVDLNRIRSRLRVIGPFGECRIWTLSPKKKTQNKQWKKGNGIDGHSQPLTRPTKCPVFLELCTILLHLCPKITQVDRWPLSFSPLVPSRRRVQQLAVTTVRALREAKTQARFLDPSQEYLPLSSFHSSHTR